MGISLEEECTILSIRENSETSENNFRCTNCSRLGHTDSKCMFKGRLCLASAQEVMSFISGLKCGQAGHLVRDC